MQVEQFIFLCQPSYAQVGITPMSDFRSIFKADFDIIHDSDDGGTVSIIIQAIKPSRIKNES